MPSQEERENEEGTPCGDNICEECPKFEDNTCDIVNNDQDETGQADN